MASNTKIPRPLRSLIGFFVVVVVGFGALLAGVKWSDATLVPEFALDLAGGTQVILTPTTTDGSQVTDSDISQAINIIRQRVDARGVAEAEITSQGGSNIVVGIPGDVDDEAIALISRSAQMNFRPVLVIASSLADLQTGVTEGTESEVVPEEDTTEDPAQDSEDETTEDPAEDVAPQSLGVDPAGVSTVARTVPVTTDEPAATDEPAGTEATPETTVTEEAVPLDDNAVTADPSNPSDLAQITPEVQAQFDALQCLDPAAREGGNSGDPDAVLVTCSQDGAVKYILGPVEIPGTMIDSASSGLRQLSSGATSNEWVVNIEFTSEGAELFRTTTERLAGLYQQGLLGSEVAPNLFAMALDGLVVSAPSVESVIPDGRAEISGTFTRQSAADLANQLNFGALPLEFTVQSQQEVSATLGSEQLEKGLLAGVIGLILVVLYSLVQYRALGLVTVASLTLATLVTYLAITLLSWTGYRLSLAGVAGLIVAIGITADSFIVYFERIRDELRDGRTLQSAVEKGWARAKRTILASDAVNFLAAVVLYFLAVGGVRGFAFTLGLTTVVDLLIVFFFTHPLMQLVARTRFFATGHPWSGLDPRRLGVTSLRYAGRGRVKTPEPAGAVTQDAALSAPSADDSDQDDVDHDDAEVPRKREYASVATGAPVYDAEGRRLTIAERRAAARAAQKASGDAPPDEDAPAQTTTNEENH
ncbi:MAG: protein translocase subunit SecD [Cellulomonadaceae bacterium]